MELELYGNVVRIVDADAQAPVNSKATHWAFTWNNPAENEAPNWNPDKMAYMVYQKEKGANGTIHWQGYVRFKGQQRFNAVKSLLGNSAIHIAIARGTEEQNHDYCTKADTRIEGTSPTEFGEYKKDANRKGQRSDLTQIADKIKQGASIKDVALNHPADYIRYSMGIERLAQKIRPIPPLQRTVLAIWMWGPTSTGKTHRVLHRYSEPYQVIPGRDPWGHYEGQAVVLFDEFDLKRWSPQEMNRFADKWRLKLDCRYHDKYAEWNLIILVSNDSPESVLAGCPCLDGPLGAAINRRFQWPCGLQVYIDSRTDNPPLPPDPQLPENKEGWTKLAEKLADPESQRQWPDLWTQKWQEEQDQMDSQDS